jgi:hypothetical protein
VNAAPSLRDQYDRFRVGWAALWENGDPDSRAVRRDALIAQKERLCRADEANLVAALRQEGFDGSSVWDLVNAKTRYQHLHSVLIEHAGLDYLPPTREGIYRALMDARGNERAFDMLVGLWRDGIECAEDGNRWALALAISLIAKGKKQVETLAELYDADDKAAEPMGRRLAEQGQGRNGPANLNKVMAQ